jgi:hypothetical protein
MFAALESFRVAEKFSACALLDNLDYKALWSDDGRRFDEFRIGQISNCQTYSVKVMSRSKETSA